MNGKPDGTINREQLAELLKLIDYQTDQFDEIADKLFNIRERINFNQFMKILDLKLDDYTK